MYIFLIYLYNVGTLNTFSMSNHFNTRISSSFYNYNQFDALWFTIFLKNYKTPLYTTIYRVVVS